MTSSELIPIAKFGEICRTCLKEEDDLKPLYEMCIKQTCIIEMLMACTFIRVRSCYCNLCIDSYYIEFYR